jgi:uncharacterized membrane protein YjfL (UPF0719 family)
MSKFQAFLAKPGTVTFVLFIAAAGLFGLSLLEFIEVSGFTAAAVKLGILAAFFLFADKILLRAFPSALDDDNRTIGMTLSALTVAAGLIIAAA